MYYADEDSGMAGMNALGVTVDLTNCDDLLQRAAKNAQLLQTHPNSSTYKKNGQLRYNQYVQCIQARGQSPQALLPFSNNVSAATPDFNGAIATAVPAAPKKAKKPGILDALVNAITPAGNAPYTDPGTPAVDEGGGSIIPGGILGIGALVVAGGAVIYFMTRKSKGGSRRYRTIGRRVRRAARRARRTYRRVRSRVSRRRGR